MYRSFKVEIDPTPEQITKINKTIGRMQIYL
ncbi:helix-turn-helix domain-containing protein [Ruminococcus sp.]|nr:helix-turn-helix domain-containing protein [Ruminococcus sp.]